MTDAELIKRLDSYPWYHRIELRPGVITPGFEGEMGKSFERYQEAALKVLRSIDLRGKKVLDIGCRDGLFSFEAARLGAAEVIGIDSNLSRGAVEVLIPHFRMNVRMEEMNLLNLRPEHFGHFDVVLFFGVLYHLRYPFLALKIIRDVMRPGTHLLIDTPFWEGEPDRAILWCPVDDGPYAPDTTSCTFFNERGLTDTIRSYGFRHLMLEAISPRWVPPVRSRRDEWRRALKLLFTGWQPPPALPEPPVNRGTFLSVYEGYDAEGHPWKYWDATHNIHDVHCGRTASQDRNHEGKDNPEAMERLPPAA